MLKNISKNGITLSICIPTLNRANYISETLDSITVQLQDCVEVVIVDGGSTDSTESIVKKYQESFPSIRYFKKSASNNTPSNEGFDRDCNQSVSLANGEYCWLMTDDDLILPDAIKNILNWIKDGYELVILNTKIANKDITETLVNKRPDIESDKTYFANSTGWNKFAAETGFHITFVGAVVIKTETWLNRDQASYFGTGFVHVGVIFQRPFLGNILVTSTPLIVIRYGNAQWSSRAFKIWMYDWPRLIWSFKSISDDAKRSISLKEPWRKISILLRERVLGNYSIIEYKHYIESAEFPLLQKLIAKIIAVTPRRALYYLAMIFVQLKVRNNKFNKFTLNESWNQRNV